VIAPLRCLLRTKIHTSVPWLAAFSPRVALVAGLVYLAVMPAFAQSAVNGDDPAPAEVVPYGILDGGVRRDLAASTQGGITQFASGLNTSRIGMRGAQELLRDLRVTARLESGFAVATGIQSNSTTLFDRNATIGLRTRDLDLQVGRMEGFGYTLAAAGTIDPLSMALNLPNYSSPPAASVKAPVLGINPLQGVYSYTYGQLRYNNAIRLTRYADDWSAGVMLALRGTVGGAPLEDLRAVYLDSRNGPVRLDGLIQQASDAQARHSTLAVLAGAWTTDLGKFQAGIHALRIDAGFDAASLGDGASQSGILGNSTTVSTRLAGPGQAFRLTVLDLGGTWQIRPTAPFTLAAYQTQSAGAGSGSSLALVALAKRYLSPRVAFYAEADHSRQAGTLGFQTVSGRSTGSGCMAGLNVRF